MTWTSRYFTLAEMTASDTAVRHGLINMPIGDVLKNLTETALKMDVVRDYLGHPIRVNSGYRGHELNQIIGGSDTSAHCLGYAVDFVCSAYGSPLKVATAIRDSGMKFDQLIAEGTWLHLSFDPRMRQQVLTAHFHSGHPTTYTPGL